MQDRQTKTIEGSTLFGDKRSYTFKILTAEQGVKYFHEYASIIVTSVPILKSFVETDGEQSSIDVMEIIRLVPTIFTWEKIKELACSFLSGSTVEIDGKVYTTPENGIGDFTIGDPLELHCQLFWAIVANYPKYLGPLVNTSDGTESGVSTRG